MPLPTSSSHYFREALVGARRAGLDDEALLAAVGLSWNEVGDPEWRGDLSVLARLVRLVVDALDDEFMGYTDTRSKPGTFAMMVHISFAEPTLEQAIRKGVLFYTLATDALEMAFESSGDQVTWTVQLARPELDPAHYFVEFWASIWFRLWGWLTGSPPELNEVMFAHDAASTCATELELLFGRQPVFSAEANGLVLSRPSLERPILRDRDELKEFLAASPLSVMTPTTGWPNVANRVASVLEPRRGAPLEFPTFAQVAERLYYSEQTLRRKLRQEATSYRTIKEQTRRQLAERLLTETKQPVRKISRLTGYSEPRAFTRAFREWTGLSPAEFRISRRRPTA